MQQYNKYDSRRWKAAWYLTLLYSAFLAASFIDQQYYFLLQSVIWGAYFTSFTVQKTFGSDKVPIINTTEK